jgi:hypothetical protein
MPITPSENFLIEFLSFFVARQYLQNVLYIIYIIQLMLATPPPAVKSN